MSDSVSRAAAIAAPELLGAQPLDATPPAPPPPPGFQPQIRRRISAVSSLKEIVFMLTTLTITTAIAGLVNYANVSPVAKAFTSPEFIIFATLLINVVRFSHGNVRLLDDSYLYDTEYGKEGGIVNFERRNTIYLDFAFVLLLSILFSFSAFYLHQPKDFALLFLFVLGVDVVWAILSLHIGAPKERLSTQMHWLWNNIACGIGILVLVIVDKMSAPAPCPACIDYYSVGALLVIWLNTFIDLYVNWAHYFPPNPIRK